MLQNIVKIEMVMIVVLVILVLVVEDFKRVVLMVEVLVCGGLLGIEIILCMVGVLEVIKVVVDNVEGVIVGVGMVLNWD